MKRFLFAFFVVFFTVCGAQAQYADRIGGDKAHSDSITEHYLQLQKYMKGQNWREAFDEWYTVFYEAPLLDVKYLYLDPAQTMFNSLIEFEQDPDMRLWYFQNMMTMFKTRLANLDALNDQIAQRNAASSEEGENDNYMANSPGELKVRMQYYRSELGEKAYRGTGKEFNKETCYKSYSEAIEEVIKKGGRDIEPTYLQNYINLTNWMLNTKGNEHLEHYLADYMFVSNLCDSLMAVARDLRETDSVQAQYIVDKYRGPQALNENGFQNSRKLLSLDVLQDLFAPRIEVHKGDLDYLLRMLDVLRNSGCDTIPVYYTAADYAYSIRPTFESAIALGQRHLELGNQDQARSKYDEAMRYAPNKIVKGAIALRVGAAMLNSKDFTVKEYSACTRYLDIAEECNPDYMGKAEYFRARAAYRYALLCWVKGQNNEFGEIANAKAAFDVAIVASNKSQDDMLQRSVTSEWVTANLAPRKAKFDKWYNESWPVIQANKKAMDKYNRERAEAERKRKEEEAFWNGSR